MSLVALDDTVVLVARPGRTRAVTDRDAVAALRALAESEWDRAQPDGDALAPSEDTLLRLLAEGKTDTAVAVRLGVSPAPCAVTPPASWGGSAPPAGSRPASGRAAAGSG